MAPFNGGDNTNNTGGAINETSAASKNVANLLADARRTVSGASELAGSDSANQGTTVTASEATGSPWIESEAKISEICDHVRQIIVSDAAEEAQPPSGAGADASDAVAPPDAATIARASQFWVRACLLARKGDPARAAALLRALVAWKLRLGVPDNSEKEKLAALLHRGLIWSSGMRDKLGRYILHIRLRNADPATFTPIDVVRTVAATVEWTFRNYPAAQTHGIIVLGDASGIGLRNIDPRVPRELAHSFSSTLPVRVGCFCVMNLPWFIRPVFALISRFLNSKLKARIRQISRREELASLFDPASVPVDANMGGTLHWDAETVQKKWAQSVLDEMETWESLITS